MVERISNNMTRIAVILLAGGSGSRAGKAKQFHQVLEKPLLQYSIDAFALSRVATEIVVAVPESKIAHTRRIVTTPKAVRLHVIAGGTTRRWTTARALSYLATLSPAPTHVIVHDAARPLITPKLIRTVTKTMLTYGAAVTGIPSNGIPLEVKNGLVRDVYNKEASGLHDGTTPQCFPFPDLVRAYEKTNTMRTIDPSADNLEILKAVRSRLKIRMVHAYPNHKVTYPEDFALVEGLLSTSARKKRK